MTQAFAPPRCYLCNASDGIVSARFHQRYPLQGLTHVLLDWWECSTCRGWFAYPIPSPEFISEYLTKTDYNDPSAVLHIANGKAELQRRILKGLSDWTKPGELLDFGCNFGEFLVLARAAGWMPRGFEPYTTAANAARKKGFDVRSNWLLDEAGFSGASFSAITAIDVFCLVWDPISTLRAFHRLLKPGGVLAMRLTNKRFIAGLARALTPSATVRDATISKILLDQFHSVGVNSFRRILQTVGFDRVEIQPHAVTAPWSVLPWQTRIAYVSSAAIYRLSLSTVNLSPGVLLFARKIPVDSGSSDGRRAAQNRKAAETQLVSSENYHEG